MGTQVIIHGRINLKGNFEKSRQFIKSLNKSNDKYPWINAEMFSPGLTERPYYYEEPVIAFASDYSGLESRFTLFVIKFENVLKNIEFKTAKLQMETEYYGTYNFFWKSKSSNHKFEEEQLIETPEWYFGFGERSYWGDLTKPLEDKNIFSIDFEYPIKFDTKALAVLNAVTETININDEVYLNVGLKTLKEKLEPILTCGYINKMLD